jgi:Uma2 family endonuclease
MTASPILVDYAPLLVHLRPAVDMTEEQFFEFCQINRDLRIERSADGDLIIMAPAGARSGARNAEITLQLVQWAKQDGRGVAFDSSAGFRLPNGAVRGPDAAWVDRSRLDVLDDETKDRFLPLCPDFVIELRSPSDALKTVQEKMEEYRANGARLGWLIDPVTRRARVYTPDAPPRELVNPAELTGEPVLPGFVLNLTAIWEPSL